MRNVNSGGAADSMVIAATKAKLIRLTIFNAKASSQYIHIFDAASLPANGATPDYPPMYVGTKQTVIVEFNDFGRNFDNGIVVCNSSTEATKTIGSEDCWFDAQVMPVDGDPKNYR
ncbi:MAG: hypothetical protein H6937_09540 [Burkholderiales bacterium]|nr:hypothetical protein [Burkholderiales bacterium]